MQSSFLACTYALNLGSVDETEDVVQNEEAAGAIGLELEALGVAHGLLLLINNESTGNQDNDATLAGGLGIKGGNLVAHLLEGKGGQLLDNTSGTLNRGSLEGEHRLVTVERSETTTVGVESLVVELNELLSDGGEVGHFEERSDVKEHKEDNIEKRAEVLEGRKVFVDEGLLCCVGLEFCR